MTVISDGLLARRYNEIEAKKEQIDSSNVLPLLAAIADHWLKGDADAMLPKLQAASSKDVVHGEVIGFAEGPE